MARDTTRINRMIRAPQVRVVDMEGNQLGIMAVDEAMRVAEEAGLDLVEVAAQAKPPVCRIMDYGKFKYQMSKKARDAKKKQTVVQVKEMKFRCRIEEHDFQFKLRNIKRFLEDGDKVKVYVMFRGREITHTELGKAVLDRVAADLKELAQVDVPTKLEGRNMTMILSPLPQKGAGTGTQAVRGEG